MKKIKKKKLLVFFSFVILTLSLVPTGITASNGYDVVLETGSQVLEVEYFNPLLWDNIISTNFTPSDWFEGNSDCVGAQSKYTNLWKHGFNEITHTIFNTLFFSWYNIPYLDVLKQNGYDYDYIDINYPDTYDIVQVYNRYWAFRNQPFNDFPYDRIKESIVFLNLTDISKSLTNYNNFALVVNNDSVIQALDVNLPIINMD